jgi:hypothetical protein
MSDQAEPKSLPGDTHPRADVLAEEYRGRYLWDELEKARERIADLEEQLEAMRQALLVCRRFLLEDGNGETSESDYYEALNATELVTSGANG